MQWDSWPAGAINSLVRSFGPQVIYRVSMARYVNTNIPYHMIFDVTHALTHHAYLFPLLISHISGYLCGGLTSFVTLGFVHGLMTGKKFHMLELDSDKKRYVKNGYRYAAVSALGLALCANSKVAALLGKNCIAAAIAAASCAMASAISFQFYQLPAKAATLFGENKAICVSVSVLSTININRISLPHIYFSKIFFILITLLDVFSRPSFTISSVPGRNGISSRRADLVWPWTHN